MDLAVDRAQTAAALLALSLAALPVLGALGTLQTAPGTGGVAAPDGETATRAGEIGQTLLDSTGVGSDEPTPRGEGRLRSRGYTADGAKVGVIGAGFAAASLADADAGVADRQRLAPDRPAGPATAHDTAVAEVVGQTAPGADLYLAGVGRSPTPERYARAIEWLVANDVEVIVDSGSYFPSVAGDGERITAAAERAAAEGVVFVTSAGNYAERHWAGRRGGAGWVAFANGSEANRLAGGDPVAGRVSLRLRWTGRADFDLYLYRRTPGGPDPVVAKSVTRTTGPGRAVESIDAVVPRGRYYAAVHAPSRPAERVRLQLFSTRHGLEHATPHGSMVAPAAGEHVVAVGAVGPDGEPRSYSSRGGFVDVAGPGTVRTDAAGDLSGTSAAAPYVAGTAALVDSRGGDLAPGEVERILESTAAADGVDPVAAVRAAAEPDAETDAGATQGRTEPPTGEPVSERRDRGGSGSDAEERGGTDDGAERPTDGDRERDRDEGESGDRDDRERDRDEGESGDRDDRERDRDADPGSGSDSNSNSDAGERGGTDDRDESDRDGDDGDRTAATRTG
jgi:hypothetical protein